MDEFAKGIFYIENVKIQAGLSTKTVTKKLLNRFFYHIRIELLQRDYFGFDDVEICGRKFSVDLTFERGLISSVKLYSQIEVDTVLTSEAKFYLDYKWVNDIFNLSESVYIPRWWIQEDTRYASFIFPYHVVTINWERLHKAEDGPEEFIEIVFKKSKKLGGN